ncbi:hypothetical protein M0P98_05960 [bacterium]|nr:hypothetical protein [bacterium]
MRIILFLLTFFYFINIAGSGENNLYSKERYNILYEKNIYLKDRSVPKVLPPVVEKESILREKPIRMSRKILTGIVAYGSEFVAFFEDISLRKTERVRSENIVLNKKIKSITLDYVEYVENDRVFRVKVGESISGVIGQPDDVDVSAVNNIIIPEKPQPVEIVTTEVIRVVDKPDESTLLERLRLRRQRELQ